MLENNAIDRLMLHIERQAVLEVLLHELADSLESRSKLVKVSVKFTVENFALLY